MVDDFLLAEDGNRSADTQDLSAVNVKEKVRFVENILMERSTVVL